MKSPMILHVLLAALLLTGTQQVLAHHSFAAEFDAEKTTQFEGVVTKVEWTNPHVWIYLNVKDAESGEVTNWGVELGAPHLLQRRGWRRNTLTIGTQIKVDGYLARNGSSRVNGRSVTLATTGGAPGTVLDAGSSQLDRSEN
ncbi:MAG: DUF6152 family protein [Pseudomonadales bacterium]|nr:DUF6152 family protein [Pseudomonadales bacterium]